MRKLLSRLAREVWMLLRFIAFLAGGTYCGLRVVWFALRHPVLTFGLVLLGYALFLAVRSAMLSPG
ncbi:hypothetical protein DBB29_25020 [Pandoraea cepalis]|uniref:Uncharacterized protein n=1 Tax=Pandoraea cepalis TaxID=2508294 RepID=A0AAW7MGU5_9BURK|nr:hypothetical protein [Pandoraea cepalis]MDN4571925.1 hypothetical protein [Pandoraea cepalis]MDN4581379.1 hypothetical protein [Pandoraea cepalis]